MRIFLTLASISTIIVFFAQFVLSNFVEIGKEPLGTIIYKSNSSINIPFSTLNMPGETLEIEFKLSNPGDQVGSYIYFEHLGGSLAVYSKANQLLGQTSPERFFRQTSLNNWYLKLPEGETASSIKLIYNSADKEISSIMSPYLLDEGELAVNIDKNRYVYEGLRFGIFVSELIALLSLIILVIAQILKFEALPLVIISIFVVLQSFGNVIAQANPLSDYFVYVLYLAPLCGLSVFFLGMSADQVCKNIIWFIGLAFFAFALIVLKSFEVLSPGFIHLLFNIPIFLCLMFCRVIYICFYKESDKRFADYFLTTSILVAIITFVIDIAAWIGYLELNGPLSHIAILLFSISSMIYFASFQIELKNQAESNASTMKSLLSEQQKRLDKKNSHLVSMELMQQKNNLFSSFANDLHDGLLGYLHMVNILADSPSSSDATEIKKLSVRAIQEIRIILHQQEEVDFNLKAFVNFVDEVLCEPLRYTGTQIEFDQTKLKPEHFDCVISNLQLFRIMQEAVHNASARANSKKISLRFWSTEFNMFHVEIENSMGRPLSIKDKLGNGIQNMINRARSVSAEFNIEPSSEGAIISLKYPLQNKLNSSLKNADYLP
jgi:signal transduction histidine kinase